MVALCGTKEQKKKYLTPLTAGQAVMGSAITEPDAGSDVAAFRADKGKPDHKLTAMAKWFAGETAVVVAEEAVQIHGGLSLIHI